MKNLACHLAFFLLTFPAICSQTLDADFATEKMVHDLQVFKNIRHAANSGLYKYRTVAEVDSIYRWAEQEVRRLRSYREFYNLICHLTDFEGSLHNDTSLPSRVRKRMRKEATGYFPYPIKLVEGKVLLNLDQEKIPLGAEILSINQHPVAEMLPNFYKYYTTDGCNISGKAIGINYRFAIYYRLHYGLEDEFVVGYRPHGAAETKEITLNSVAYLTYAKNVAARHSKPYDAAYYRSFSEPEIYTYEKLDDSTGLFVINSFAIGGGETAPEHLRYVAFLDSIFGQMKTDKIAHLIVDVRNNGGGTDPNDMVTYGYLTDRKFSENTQAWISFRKIPYLRHINHPVPTFLRALFVGKYNKELARLFPLAREGKYYQDSTNADQVTRHPDANAFTGKVYLLISPRVASAGSMFAAMVAGNANTTVVGEEAMGGYYGHNGHTPLSYVLPRSKIEIDFSIVNLEQDVPRKANQIYNRGIIPDHQVSQSYTDFLQHTDTQMNYVLALIRK